MINTIFYFPESLTFDEYKNKLAANEIADKTIVFAKAQKSIYMGGECYSGSVAPEPEKIEVTLSWSNDTYNATIGGTNNYPTLNGGEGLAIVYSSSDSNIASIDSETGVITLNTAGQCIITASFEGDDTHTGSTASYTLNVQELVIKNHVWVGHGATYENVEFEDTNASVKNNLEFSVDKNDGDYIFIKYDNRDTINTVFTVLFPTEVEFEEFVPENAEEGFTYIKSISPMNAGKNSYVINKK